MSLQDDPLIEILAKQPQVVYENYILELKYQRHVENEKKKTKRQKQEEEIKLQFTDKQLFFDFK
ncbi:MAG: hypothetical protein K0U47_12610 [Epsilonproteobacteria bacterium]|nr:hypothetical protein [Campylobacterota bacterium]